AAVAIVAESATDVERTGIAHDPAVVQAAGQRELARVEQGSARIDVEIAGDAGRAVVFESAPEAQIAHREHAVVAQRGRRAVGVQVRERGLPQNGHVSTVEIEIRRARRAADAQLPAIHVYAAGQNGFRLNAHDFTRIDVHAGEIGRAWCRETAD